MLLTEQLSSTPLLVVVNKVDPGIGEQGNATDPVNGLANTTHLYGSTTPISPEIASNVLGLDSIIHSRVSVVCCSATAGTGVQGIISH